MSWISAARGARTMRFVGAVALVSAVLTPVAGGATSALATTAPPSIASTSYPKFVSPSSMRWRGTHWSATPSFRWQPTTTAGVAKYQVQTWHGKRRGSMVGTDSMGSGYQSTIANYSASRTSVAGHLYSGDQVCRRVRAVNSVGTAGRWSGWKCSHAPLGTEEFEPYGFDNGVFDYYVRNIGSSHNPVRSASYLAKGVRLKVRTGPTHGKARILIGSTLLGTVSGYATTYGYKVVTLQKSANLTGAIKVRAISADTRPFRFVGLWALRATAPLGSSKVVSWQPRSKPWPVMDPVESSDTTRPTMTGFSLSPTFPATRNSNGIYSVKASWRGSDNTRVAGYEVATKYGGSTSYYDAGSSATTSTSKSVYVDWAGSATCHRIRAYDAAGNFSPWTGWKCSFAPITPMDGHWTAGVGALAGGKTWTSVRTRDDFYHQPARTTDRYSAKKLRIQYRVGPKWGRAKVYVGGTYFGTINAYAAAAGNRWVTLTGTREAHERIRFVPVTTKDVLIGKVFVIPDPAKNLPSAPIRG